MIEEKRSFRELLGPGQNFYDQPSFEGVNAVGREVEDLEGVRRFTTGLARRVIKMVPAIYNPRSASPITDIDVPYLPDLQSKFTLALRYATIDIGRLVPYLKNEEQHNSTFGRELVASVLGQIDEPFWAFYYISQVVPNSFFIDGEPKLYKERQPSFHPPVYSLWRTEWLAEKLPNALNDTLPQ